MSIDNPRVSVIVSSAFVLFLLFQSYKMHTCLSATRNVLISSQRNLSTRNLLRDPRFRAPGLVISVIWKWGVLLKMWALWWLKDDPGQTKNLWNPFILFLFLEIVNMIAYRRCRQTRQLSLYFVCTESHTRSLQILLNLPFNLGLFTHGLNLFPSAFGSPSY